MDLVRVLKKDAKGPDVQSLSEQLSSLGYDTGSVIEQTFGSGLERAVHEFQTDFGLKADGTVGPATMKALAEALKLLRPGSLRVSSEARTRISELHDEIFVRMKELSQVMGRSLELNSEIPLRQFTLTRAREGRRVDIKLNTGRIPVSTTPLDARPNDEQCVVYIDPPGICRPCSPVVVITAVRSLE